MLQGKIFSVFVTVLMTAVLVGSSTGWSQTMSLEQQRLKQQQEQQKKALEQQKLKQEQEQLKKAQEQQKLKQQQEQQKKALEQQKLKQQQEQQKKTLEQQKIKQQQEQQKKAKEQEKLKQQKEQQKEALEQQRLKEQQEKQKKAQEQQRLKEQQAQPPVTSSRRIPDAKKQLEHDYWLRSKQLKSMQIEAERAGDAQKAKAVAEKQKQLDDFYKKKSATIQKDLDAAKAKQPATTPPPLPPRGQATAPEVVRLEKEKEKMAQGFRDQWSKLAYEKLQAEYVEKDMKKAKALAEKQKQLEKQWGKQSDAYQKQIDAVKTKQPAQPVSPQPGKAAGGAVAPSAFDRHGQAGGMMDGYLASKAKVQKTDAKIKELEAKQKDLTQQYIKKQQEIDEMQVPKGGSIQSIQAAAEFQEKAKKDMQDIMTQKKDLDKQKEVLLKQKAGQEKQVTAAIPPPPWENRKPTDPKDFATQKQNAYKDYIWKETFGATKEEKESAKQNYNKVVTAIEKNEAAAKAEAAVSGKTPPTPTGPSQKTGAGQALPTTATATPPVSSGKSAGPVTPTTAPTSPGAGKETLAEIYDVGGKAPKSVFLTEAEVKAKKELFKDNPYGFHEIKTKDGKVIDVVANKKDDADAPSAGYITVGSGKDAKTTGYQYKESPYTVGGEKHTGVTDEVLSKKIYKSVNEQIAEIRKKQQEALQRDDEAKAKAWYTLADNDDKSQDDALRRKYDDAVIRTNKEHFKFEQQIQQLDPSYEPKKLGPIE